VPEPPRTVELLNIDQYGARHHGVCALLASGRKSQSKLNGVTRRGKMWLRSLFVWGEGISVS
jgi:hypothetical protein